MPQPSHAGVEQALAALHAGRMVVVVDDEDRENEGDLVLAAEHATPAAINFMIREARGLVCLALPPERCDALGLRPMALDGGGAHRTAFTVSIDAREGTTTGVSPADRALTIRRTLEPAAGPQDFVRGGHVFPLRARAGGVLERAGHTEAGVDLARLAGLEPGAVICEIVNDDGTMARMPDLEAFAAEHELPLLTVADLIAHLQREERLVERVVETALPTAFGAFTAVGYRSLLDAREHLALVKGDVRGGAAVPVRVHAGCLLGDVFHVARCDCGTRLEAALRRIADEPCGVLVYLAPGDEPVGRHAACLRRDEDAEVGLREHGVGAQILADLGLSAIRVLSDRPRRPRGLDGYGLTVVGHEPLVGRVRAA